MLLVTGFILGLRNFQYWGLSFCLLWDFLDLLAVLFVIYSTLPVSNSIKLKQVLWKSKISYPLV